MGGDDELATCVEFDDYTWDQRLLESLAVQNALQENEDSGH